MKPSPRQVSILTEAGPAIGCGHFARCAAIYDAFQEAGASPRLIVRGGGVTSELIEGRHTEFTDWLADPEAAAAGATVAIVDSYEAPIGVCEAIGRVAAVSVWVDDEARLDYPPGIVLNSGVSSGATPYKRRPGTVYLLGPSYHPLRRAFRRIARHVPPRVGRVLVTLGGSDVRGLGLPVAQALRAAGVPVVDLADGNRSAEQMALAMCEADLAVSAAGQTLFELAASGVPTVGIVVADNQRQNADGWERAGFLKVAGAWNTPDIIGRVVQAVRTFEDRGVRLAAIEAGRRLIDDHGARRITSRCLAAADVQSMTLRPAFEADMAPLLALANDPVVRLASFQRDFISPAQHESWFRARLADPKSLLLVLEDDSGLVGQLRFEIDGWTAKVSLSLADRARSRGLGLPFLERGIAHLVRSHSAVASVVALVRPENAASLAMFLADGFRETAHINEMGHDAIRLERALLEVG